MPECKQLVEDYFCEEDKLEGAEIADCKVYKRSEEGRRLTELGRPEEDRLEDGRRPTDDGRGRPDGYREYGKTYGAHREPYSGGGNPYAAAARDPYAPPKGSYSANTKEANPYTKDPYTKDPYSKDPYTKDPYSKDPYSKDPYSKDPYSKDPYRKDSYSKDSYSKDSYSKDPYVKDNYGKESYGKDKYVRDGSDYGGKDYGGKDYGGKDYGGKDYGGKDYGGKDYGGRDYGGSRDSYSKDSYGSRDYGGGREYGKDHGGKDYGDKDYGGKDYGGRRLRDDDYNRSKPRTEQERKMKELEDARRDDMTVLVINLPLRATEQDIIDFFSHNAGKVRAIKLVTDSRGKSKGIGYVEFEDSTAVLRSLGLTGQMLMGQAIRVQASQAEKNRAARAAKAQQDLASAQAPTKLYIGNLVDQLADLGAADLRMLFLPFGTIINIDVPKDGYTQKNKGYAIIQYAESEQARDALLAMHGFEVQGVQIKIGFATTDDEKKHETDQRDEEDDVIGSKAVGRGAGTAGLLEQHCSDILCLNNMFSKQEVNENGYQIIDEIEDDVTTECLRFGIIIDLFLDEELLDGKIFVRFATTEEACEAFRGLHGRYFGGQKIEACFVDPLEFNKLKAE
ncbi:putative splicing factor [Gregarina niphandrodes]|uniref:Splicing factor n=1 Tax=Gregarina niphandrodes TaxID=110365 RepID=A0A023B6X6_GRENI|nr:putative splicing factor [Gregarina niphandrodes]EZG66808.1 putative splicing factor [Gregarina niphandrodes]|eukprot:XP_011130480.1 putative splicing factor [Gregarina niphandrodes]